MNTQPEDQLRRALRSQAERGAPHEIEMDAVTATARGIRRRRTAAAAISTAAVVALAVPAGMALTGTLEDDAPPVAGQEQQMEPPAELLEVELLDAEPSGDAAALPYVKDGAIVVPGGDPVDIGGQGRPMGVDVVGDRWLVLKDLGEGEWVLDTTTPQGEVVDSVPARTGPVTSPDGTVAAYLAGNGDLHTITEADGDLTLATKDRIGSPERISAVVGSQTCKEAESEQGGCTVYVDGGAGARYATSHGIVDDVPGFLQVADAHDGSLLGMVSADDFGSCSALRDVDGEQLWKTCDNSFDSISPDGRWAIGLPAYLDGLGPRSMSINDMADGRELVRFSDTGQGATTVFGYRWESDSTVLVTVWDDETKTWRLLRAGIDGSLTEVDSTSGKGSDPMMVGGPPAISLG